MNAIEKRLAEQMGALLIDNAKLATTVELQTAEINRLKAELAKSVEPSLPIHNGNGHDGNQQASQH